MKTWKTLFRTHALTLAVLAITAIAVALAPQEAFAGSGALKLATLGAIPIVGLGGMLLNQPSAATATSLIDAASCANTAAATSGAGKWLDVRPYDGEILVTQQLGAVTGSIAGKLQSATDANGSGAADITGYTFGTNTANSTSTIAVDPKKVVGGFLGYVGTIVTGPSLVSVVASGKKKVV